MALIGQEQDDEIKGVGNSVNYKYRMHDARIGRFISLDPLAPDYPHNSPYAFSENRVIDGVELEGLEYISDENLRAHQDGDCQLENINSEELESVIYNNTTYHWLGYEITDSEGNLSTTWINESLSTAEQNGLRDYYDDYDQSARRRLNECHTAGCCIDCFNGAINELLDIDESQGEAFT